MSVEVFSIFMVSMVSVSDSGGKFSDSCLIADNEGCVQSVSVVVIFMDLDLFLSKIIGSCVSFVTTIFPCEMLTNCGCGH